MKKERQMLFEMFRKVNKVKLNEEFNPSHYAWGSAIERMLAYAQQNNIQLDIPHNLEGLDYGSMDSYIDSVAGQGGIVGEEPSDEEIVNLVNGYNDYESNQGEQAFERFSDDYFGGSSPVTDKEKYMAAAQQKRELGENQLNESLVKRFEQVNKINLKD